MPFPRTRSGDQPAASDLEADLCEQIAFADSVFDVVTQVAVDGGADKASGPRTVSLALQIAPRHHDGPTRYLVQVVTGEMPANSDRERRAHVRAAREFAKREKLLFRCLREAEIRTGYLRSARRFGRHVGVDPDNALLNAVLALTDAGSMTIADLVAALVASGTEPAAALTTVEQAIANRFVHCDLDLFEGDEMRVLRRTMRLALDPFTDPLLRRIRDAGDA